MSARDGYSEAAARDRRPLVLSLPGGVVSETGFLTCRTRPLTRLGIKK